jgi:hypothetical protein
MKHTHRGTCQACGRAQAFTSDQIVAKHGYTVDWGFFHGVCQGADARPLEHQKTLSESIIKILRDQALRNDKLAADLETGIVDPQWTKRERRVTNRRTGFAEFVRVPAERAELNDYEQQQQRNTAAYKAQSQARHERSHADMLEKLIEARHGQPLIPVEREARKELAVGARVQIGGKNGIVCEVVEIKPAVARGCGPYLNGRVVMHAFLKRADRDGIFAIPTRSIRANAIIDGGAQ